MVIKLLQWNIWYQESIENVTNLIKSINPDIVCIQELTQFHPEHNINIDTLKYLTNELDLYYFYKPSHTDPQNTFGNIILSRYPIIYSGFNFITKPKDKIESFSDQGRVYIECAIDIEGRKIQVATTHLSYTDKFKDTDQKKTEADNLVQILRNKSNNYIFAGDLNAEPESYTIQEIEKVLKNCGPDYNQKTWTTKPFSYNDFDANTLNWRLDYCFSTSDMNVLSSKIIDTKYSDHLPILIEFNL